MTGDATVFVELVGMIRTPRHPAYGVLVVEVDAVTDPDRADAVDVVADSLT